MRENMNGYEKEDLKPREDVIDTNPPPQEETCSCCRRPAEGTFLIRQYRPAHPPVQEFEMMLAEYWRYEDVVGDEKAKQTMIEKFGKKKIDQMETYDEFTSSYGYSMECRDCACLDDYEFYEKMEKDIKK